MAVSKARMMTLAVRYLGMTNITIEDPDDPNSPFAVIFSTWWDEYIPKELEGYDWRFARESKVLTISGDFTESPYSNLGYIYAWPPFCLVPRFIPGDTPSENVPFEIGVQGNPGSRKRLIYTSKASASLIYTCDMTKDYSLFPFAFGVMIAARIALEYATKKFGAGKQLKGLQTLYGALVGEARSVDAQLSNDVHLYEKYTPRYIEARGDAVDEAMQFTQTD